MLFALACLGIGPTADASRTASLPFPRRCRGLLDPGGVDGRCAVEASTSFEFTSGPTALARRSSTWFSRVMSDHVHTCPFCELRFQFVNEVRDHVVTDHPEHADSFVGIVPHEES